MEFDLVSILSVAGLLVVATGIAFIKNKKVEPAAVKAEAEKLAESIDEAIEAVAKVEEVVETVKKVRKSKK